MVQITLSSIVPSSVPAGGWIVKYRIKGTSGAFLTAIGSPFMAQPIVFSTTDPAGTLYEGWIQSDCGSGNLGLQVFWNTPCECTGSGFVPGAGGINCIKTDSISPTITHSNFCLVASTNAVYSSYGSRIYSPGFNLATMMLPPGSIDSHIYAELSSNPQWSNSDLVETVGPMNREGVWIDSDCDGNKDSLTSGAQTTIAFMYNNTTGAPKSVYVGIGGDNQFKLVINGVIIVDTGTTISSLQFKFWHLIPVILSPGINFINAVATGDGSVNDSIGMAVYDNTAAELNVATTEPQTRVLFGSHSLRGTSYDTSTCPPNYSLDTSAGQGNYVCTRVLIKTCNSAT